MCDEKGELTLAAFEMIMRQQVMLLWYQKCNEGVIVSVTKKYACFAAQAIRPTATSTCHE